MKQKITMDQFSQLSDDAMDDFVHWCMEREYPELLNLGQLIEFLDSWDAIMVRDVYWLLVDWGARVDDKRELIDVLWDTAKELLEVKNTPYKNASTTKKEQE